MTAPTSRRAMLRGAALLTVIPVAATAGVPLVGVEDLLPSAPPSPVAHDLFSFEGRLRAISDWFALPPAPIAYDEEDPSGGILLTEELSAWFKATDLTPHFRWLFNGDTAGATAEEQRRRLLQDRECLELFRDLDKTEQGILLETLERLADKSLPPETILAEGRAKMAARRAAIAGRDFAKLPRCLFESRAQAS